MAPIVCNSAIVGTDDRSIGVACQFGAPSIPMTGDRSRSQILNKAVYNYRLFNHHKDNVSSSSPSVNCSLLALSALTMDIRSDAESLYSYASTVALDDFRDKSNELIEDFPHPPRQSGNLSPAASVKTLRRNFFINELPLLQETNPYDGSEEFNPVREDGLSYDLIAPYGGSDTPLHSLEHMAEVMFSLDHMRTILNDSRYLAQFREFLLDERPRSLSTLTYYLNACKALKAIEYANALVRLSIDVPPPSIQPFDRDGHHQPVGITGNPALERRVQEALYALTAEELPAFITSRCISITSHIVEERVRGTLPEKFQGTADALAEVFCLTDPSRPDNPIIFASEGTRAMSPNCHWSLTSA